MAKRHCFTCGGKLKFAGITRSEPRGKPCGDVLRLRWYRCTRCKGMEWVLCRDK